MMEMDLMDAPKSITLLMEIWLIIQIQAHDGDHSALVQCILNGMKEWSRLGNVLVGSYPLCTTWQIYKDSEGEEIEIPQCHRYSSRSHSLIHSQSRVYITGDDTTSLGFGGFKVALKRYRLMWMDHRKPAPSVLQSRVRC